MLKVGWKTDTFKLCEVWKVRNVSKSQNEQLQIFWLAAHLFSSVLISVWQLHFAVGVISFSVLPTLISNLSANLVFIFKTYPKYNSSMTPLFPTWTSLCVGLPAWPLLVLPLQSVLYKVVDFKSKSDEVFLLPLTFKRSRSQSE